MHYVFSNVFANMYLLLYDIGISHQVRSGQVESVPRGRSWQSVTMVETGKAEVGRSSVHQLGNIFESRHRLVCYFMGALTTHWLPLETVGG